MTEAQRLAERCEKDAIDKDTNYGCRDSLERAAAELRRLEAENTRLQASLEECSGNCTALEDQVRRMRSERHTLQAEGKHPAPCARFCESTAFQIKIRGLDAENARMRSELERPMSSEATVLVHDNTRLRAEVQALRGAIEAERERNLAAASEACRAFGKAGAVLMAAIRAKVSQ
jgi:septal ring factor EnvC (AmiA/AmiB activator)